MSANLLAEGDLRTGESGTTYADGVWSIPANGTSKDKNAANDWPTGTEAVSGNQTLHVGLSVRAGNGASVSLNPGIAYVDAAGHVKYVSTRISAKGTGAWQRVEGSFVMPSGMRVSLFFAHQGAGGAALELTAPCLSYGSPVCLASSAHTPYATQGHLEAVYATQASLKVQSDRITSEVSAREKTDSNVTTLSTKVEQNASSIAAVVATADGTATLIRAYEGGVLVAKTGANVGALVNADGSFDVVSLTWSNGVPSVSGTAASMDAVSVSLLAGQIAFGMLKSNQSNMLELRTKTTLPIIINRGLFVKEPETAGDYTAGYVTSIYPVTAHNGITIDGGALTLPKPTWTVGRAVEDKCRAVYCVHGGTVFMSVHTADDWWSIDGWVNVGPSLFSDVTHDQTTGVPPSLRPAERVYFPAATYTGDLLNGYVGTDGSIWLYHSGSVANWSFSVSWPVGGA